MKISLLLNLIDNSVAPSMIFTSLDHKVIGSNYSPNIEVTSKKQKRYNLKGSEV